MDFGVFVQQSTYFYVSGVNLGLSMSHSIVLLGGSNISSSCVMLTPGFLIACASPATYAYGSTRTTLLLQIIVDSHASNQVYLDC
jgi:hypothetical protein